MNMYITMLQVNLLILSEDSGVMNSGDVRTLPR